MPASQKINDVTEVGILDTSAIETAALKELANELIEEVRFASGKAKAHLYDPHAFPVSADLNELERIFVDLAHEAQDPVIMDRLKAEGASFAGNPLTGVAATRHAWFQAVNLQETVPIHEQLAQVREPDTVVTSMHTLSGSLPTPPDEPVSTLTWHLNRVKCETETGLTATGSDHLYIGGASIDPFGNVKSGGVHDLGKGWDSGNELAFNTDLATTNLSLGVGWPRTYYYVVAISVRGSDKLYEFLDKVVQYARDYAVRYLSTAAGSIVGVWVGMEAGAVVGSLGGPLGAVAGVAIGALVGYLVGKLIDVVWDEISDYFKGGTKLFSPITIEAHLPRQGALSRNGSDTVSFPELTWKGYHGEYRLNLDAKLNWIPSFNPVAIARMTDQLDLATTDDTNGIRLKTWGRSTEWAWSEWKEILSASVSPDALICLVSSFDWSLDAITIDRFARARCGHWEWNFIEQSSEWYSENLPDLDSGLICGSSISGVSRGPGMIDVFVTGKDGSVYTAARGPQTNNVWAGWWKVGEGVFLPGTHIAAVSRSEGRIDLFAIGLDGRVWSAAYGPGSDDRWEWTDWFPVLNELFVPGTRVNAISRKTDQIDLFAVNRRGEVRTAAWSPSANGGNWGGWWRVTENNGTFAVGTPISSVSRGSDYLDIFAIGLDGRVWTAAWGPQTDYTWKGWWPIGSAKFSQGLLIAATTRSLNHIDLFMRGFDGNIWSHAWDGNWKSFVV